MKLPSRKSKLQSLLDTVTDSVDGVTGIRIALPSPGSGNPLKGSVSGDMVRKVGLIAGGLVGLTAGSASISSLRRRTEGASDDS